QQNWYIFLATGLCGGFTTFSALSWEGLQLLQQQRIPLYLFYVMSSILGGLLFVGLGMKMAR
ncbi:MAG: fluoride efflux transporter FluC, partial [Bacteroidota bacterium]